MTSDGKARLFVWGSDDVGTLGFTPNSLLYLTINQHPNWDVTYKVAKDNFMAVSGYEDKTDIFYQKSIFVDGTSINFLLISPKAEKEKYSPIIELLATSLKSTK